MESTTRSPREKPPLPPSLVSGHLALLFVQLCFGFFPLFGKYAFEGFAPRAIATWRIVIGAVVLCSLAGIVHGRRVLPRVRDLPRLQLCALLGIALNQVLFLEGLQRSTAINAGLFIALIPVFTFAIAILVRQESFSMRRGAGILLAFAGAAYLFVAQGFDLTSQSMQGDLMLVANMICYSIYLVVSRPLTRTYPPLVMIAWFFILSLWMTPFIAWDTHLGPTSDALRPWFSLTWILVFATVVPYLLNLFALVRVRASTVASYTFLQPVIAGMTGVLFLDEQLRPALLLSAGAILTGLGLVVLRRGPAKTMPTPSPQE